MEYETVEAADGGMLGKATWKLLRGRFEDMEGGMGLEITRETGGAWTGGTVISEVEDAVRDGTAERDGGPLIVEVLCPLGRRLYVPASMTLGGLDGLATVGEDDVDT